MDGIKPDRDVNPQSIVTALKKEAESKESAQCASLLSKIYKKGYPQSVSSLRLHGAHDGKELYYNGNEFLPKVISSDKSEYEKWIKIAIRNGDTSAACKFAIELCNSGKRFDQAFKYAKFAHEKGDFQSTFLLGHCYKKGIGVKKDRAKVKDLLKLAKANGYTE